ncbi:MAG: DUF1801 domain-containing protein [Anaerolineales bacterium]|nr:DUF1801 domain-containing protein [Anaerolineales bacterium]
MNPKTPEGLKTEFPASMGKVAPRELANAGYTKLKQLTKVSEVELLKIHGVGPKAIRILRELLKEKGMSFGAASKPQVTKDAPASAVEKFMEKLDHPYKAEVEFLRKVIKKVNKDIAEEWKWNAPSYSYHGNYLVTFNLWEKGHIHLVFHNSMISKVKNKLFEGEYKDRRMVHFADMKDIKAKQSVLEKAVKDLIKLQKKENS